MRLAIHAALTIGGLALPARAKQQDPATVPVGIVNADRKPIAGTADFVGPVEAINRVEVRARGRAGAPAASRLSSKGFRACALGPRSARPRCRRRSAVTEQASRGSTDAVRHLHHRPRLAIVIAIVTTIAGALALYDIPVVQYPDIVMPQDSVTTFYPGANSAVVDDMIAQPIEAQVVGKRMYAVRSSLRRK